MLHGFKVIESAFLTEAGDPIEVPRTWRERWLAWPWRPWQRTKTVIPQVPMKKGMQLADGTLVMHPVMARQFREMIARQDRPFLR